MVPQVERIQLRVETLVFHSEQSFIFFVSVSSTLSCALFLPRTLVKCFEKQNVRFKPQPSKPSRAVASWRKPLGEEAELSLCLDTQCGISGKSRLISSAQHGVSYASAPSESLLSKQLSLCHRFKLKFRKLIFSYLLSHKFTF